MGSVYCSLGKYLKAQEYYEKALPIIRRRYGEDHPEVAEPLANLGLVYQGLGQHGEAQERLEKALSIKKRHYGANHPKVAETLANLGLVYQDLGQYGEAQERLEKALAVLERHYGEDHPKVAKPLMNLGNVYDNLGQHAEAQSRYEKSLEILEQYYGEDHPETAKPLMNLGNAYASLGQYAEAQKRLEKALAVLKRHYGEDHPDVAKPLVNLGVVYQSLGQHAEAQECYEKGLVILEQHYKEDHPDLASPHMNLGVIYLRLSQYAKAESHLAKALTVLKQYYGEYHPNVAKTLMHLGKAYQGLGQYVEAQKCLEKALKIQERQDHPDVDRILVSLSHVYADLGKYYAGLGKYLEAQEHYEKALSIQKQYYGAEHPVVVKILSAMLKLCFSAFAKAYKENNVKEAIRNLEGALKTIEKAEESKDNRYKNAKRPICHNLACMYHVASLSCSEEAYKQAYIDKAKNTFKEAVSLSDSVEANLSTTYGDFLLATGDTERGYDYLVKAITSGDAESELEYSLIERPTASPILQERVDQDKEVKLRGIDYAYYLIIHHYEDFQEAGIAMGQTRDAYLAAYQVSIDQCSGRPGQEKKDKTAYHLLGSLYEAQGDQEAAATAFARSQDGTEQEDTQAAS